MCKTQLPIELTYYLRLTDAVMIFDNNYIIIDANFQYENISGFKRQEIIGVSINRLKSKMLPLLRTKELKDALKNNNPWSGLLVKKNENELSKLIYILVTITPIKLHNKTYYLCIMRLTDQLTEEKNQKLRKSKDLIRVLALSSENRDSGIAEHLLEVQKLTERFLHALKESSKYKLNENYINRIIHYSVLHDIGKSGIPESILYKPGPLTIYEKKVMEMHPLIGVDTLQYLSKELNGTFENIDIAQNIIQYHHEKWDGSGYPFGLKEEAIPFEARVIAIVDVYDALVSKRVYKDSWSTEQAIAYLKNQKSIHFDPSLIDIFVEKVIGV